MAARNVLLIQFSYRPRPPRSRSRVGELGPVPECMATEGNLRRRRQRFLVRPEQRAKRLYDGEIRFRPGPRLIDESRSAASAWGMAPLQRFRGLPPNEGSPLAPLAGARRGCVLAGTRALVSVPSECCRDSAATMSGVSSLRRPVQCLLQRSFWRSMPQSHYS
jgi:hypothetical protein